MTRHGDANAQHYYDWRALQPSGMSEELALKRYFELMERRRDQANQQATLAGLRANCAYRRMRRMQGTIEEKEQ